MDRQVKTSFIYILMLPFLSACGLGEYLNEKARVINNSERTALVLAKENRELKAELSRLQFQLQEVKAEKIYLTAKVKREQTPSAHKRGLASVSSSIPAPPAGNSVNYDVYRWSPEQLFQRGQLHFRDKKFKEATEFFQTLLFHHPNHSLINDAFHYQAGVAAYESGLYFELAEYHMQQLMEKYPTSTFFRGAKLWQALLNLEVGKTSEFFATVEEFRKKYRNTPEWRILSAHYENIREKYAPIR